MNWFDGDRYDALLDQAAAEMSAARPEAAEHLATQAIEMQPDRHEAWTLRASVRADLMDFEHAREDVNKAIQLSAGGEAYVCRARIEYQLQEFEPAARDVEQGMSDGISDPEVLNLRGLIQLALDQPLRAVESFRIAGQKQPDEPEYELNRGNALLQLNEPGRALDLYSSIVARYPENAEARYRRGLLLMDVGITSLAIKEFLEAVRHRSEDPEYHWALGTAFEADSRFEDAESAYSAALRISPDDVVYRETRAHFRLTRRHDHTGALEDYDRLIRENPNHADYYTARGVAHLAAGHTDEAHADLGKASERAPDGLPGAIQRMLRPAT